MPDEFPICAHESTLDISLNRRSIGTQTSEVYDSRNQVLYSVVERPEACVDCENNNRYSGTPEPRSSFIVRWLNLSDPCRPVGSEYKLPVQAVVEAALGKVQSAM